MHVSKVPLLKYLWAFWRVGEARLRRRDEHLPPAVAQFQIGELVPLKGVTWRVAHIGPHGFVLAPVGFTGGRRRRLKAILERQYRNVAPTKAL